MTACFHLPFDWRDFSVPSRAAELWPYEHRYGGVGGHYCHGRDAERRGLFRRMSPLSQTCSRRAETSVMLKGNLTDLKRYLSADVQNTERLKMSASALLFPNTDKIHVFPSCLQDVKSIVADLPPPSSLRISFILTLMRKPSRCGRRAHLMKASSLSSWRSSAAVT